VPKVLGVNEERKLVQKDLIITEENGAILTYNGVETCIEPYKDVFEKLYRPHDGPDGFETAFLYVTPECNKHCSYCYDKKVKFSFYKYPDARGLVNMVKTYLPEDLRDDKDLPYQDYNFDRKHPIVRVLGGEPTIFPELGEMTKLAAEETTQKWQICTNGIVQQDKKVFEQYSKSHRISWLLSVDWNMTDNFIKKWVENMIEYGGKNEFGFSLCIDDNNWEKSMRQDELLRQYSPMEIRYRGMSEQDGSKFSVVSDLIKFVEESRSIPKQAFLDHAQWHQQSLTCLDPEFTDNPDNGMVVLARFPVWNTALVEEYCKMSSFNIATKSFWNPAEGHLSSKELFRYRMTHSEKFYHPSHKLFWNKRNEFVKR